MVDQAHTFLYAGKMNLQDTPIDSLIQRHTRSLVSACIGGLMLSLFVLPARPEVVREDVDVLATQDKVIGLLRAGAVVSVLSRNDEWSRIRYDHEYGYLIGVVPTPSLEVPMDFIVITPESPPGGQADSRRPVDADRPSLSLNSFWNTPMRQNLNRADEVQEIIASNGKPAVDLSFQNIKIYKNFRYLMPLAEARETFGLPTTGKQGVSCPGFPENSFFYYSFDRAEDGCSQLLLVTDAQDLLVGVQLTDVRPDQPRLGGHTPGHSIYNFIENSAKGKSTWRVAHSAHTQNRVVHIQSELLDQGGKCREYSHLMLPQPIVDIIAQRVLHR